MEPMGALVMKIDEHALQHPLVCQAGPLLSISKFPDWQWNLRKLPRLPPPSSPRPGAPRVRNQAVQAVLIGPGHLR
jgi:hypothetical protein